MHDVPLPVGREREPGAGVDVSAGGLMAVGDLKKTAVLLALAPDQVLEIVEQGSEGGSVAAAVGGLAPLSYMAQLVDDEEPDRRLSRSLLRGIMAIAVFKERDEAKGVLQIASQLGMSGSTTHRYLNTLVEAGLLERDPRTRKYQLAASLRHKSDS